MALKRRYEPAETFSMDEDGFFGELYLPTRNTFPGKCLILFGGSAGKFLLTQLVAEQFVDAGMNVLALAYHGAPGCPSSGGAAGGRDRGGGQASQAHRVPQGRPVGHLHGRVSGSAGGESAAGADLLCGVGGAHGAGTSGRGAEKAGGRRARSASMGIPLPYAPYVPSDGVRYQAYGRRPGTTRNRTAGNYCWNVIARTPTRKRSSRCGTSTAPSCS